MYRITAAGLWNAFFHSGRRHIILTGSRGIGKTTLLGALFPEGLPGITTWAVPRTAVYLKENGTDTIVQVGAVNEALPDVENRMELCTDGFTAVGIPALQRCMESDAEWVSIDEIGFIEASCSEYHQAVRRLLACKRAVLVVRKQSLPFLDELCHREDAMVVDLDQPYGNNGCVIMASGLGKRFGSNKLLAEFRGKPMIYRILETTEGLYRKRVVVTRHPEIAAICQEKGIEVVLHDLPGRNDTVRLGLEAVGDVDTCTFCPSDQPLMAKDTLSALALAAAADTDSIWRVQYQGEPGVPVVFPRWTYDELKNLPEGKGGGVIIKKHPEHLRMVDAQDACELMDIDSPEDLKKLETRL